MPGSSPSTSKKTNADMGSSAQPTQQSAWNVGPRQVIAAIIGVILYGFFSHVYIIILLSSNSPDIFLPALLIPLLFGVIFGPWVGLIVGGFGFLLGDFVVATWLQDFTWNNGYLYLGGALNNFRDLIGWNGIPGYLVNALLGVSAGLLPVIVRRFNSLSSLAIAGMWATICVVLSVAIVVYITVLIYQSPYYTFSEATIAFVDTALPNLLITLIIFPSLLLLRDWLVFRGKHP